MQRRSSGPLSVPFSLLLWRATHLLTQLWIAHHRAVTIRIAQIKEVLPNTSQLDSPSSFASLPDLDQKVLPAIPKKKGNASEKNIEKSTAGQKVATGLVKYHVLMNSTFAKVKRLHVQNVDGETIMEVNLKAWETTGYFLRNSQRKKDVCWLND